MWLTSRAFYTTAMDCPNGKLVWECASMRRKAPTMGNVIIGSITLPTRIISMLKDSNASALDTWLLRIMFLVKGWCQPMNNSQQTADDARIMESTFKDIFREVEAIARQNWQESRLWWKLNEVHSSRLDNFNTKDALVALLLVVSQANMWNSNCQTSRLDSNQVAMQEGCVA